MHPTFIRLCALAGACVVSMPLYAQETRASVSEAQSAAKTEQTADAPAVAQKPGAFDRLVSLGTRVSGNAGGGNGVFPIFGGPVPGSGIAAGAGLRHSVGSGAVVDASMSLSLRGYAEAQATIRSSSIEGRASIAAQVIAQDLRQLNYFGFGADSLKSDHSDYRLRRIGALALGNIRATRALNLDWRAGYTEGRLLPGTSSVTPSVEQRFDAASAPGLDETMRYVHGDGALNLDWRDHPGYPTQGGMLRAGLSRYQSLAVAAGSFSQLDVDTVHYLPIFRRNFDLIVRGRVTLARPDGGSQVPFYMLPTLGGSETLRGFSDFRFRDTDAAVVNVEYRWPVFRMMDAALFADGGRVASTPGGLLNSTLHRDYGMGVRLHTPTRAIARIDVARGNEGIRLSVSLSAPFKSTHAVAPYVP